MRTFSLLVASCVLLPTPLPLRAETAGAPSCAEAPADHSPDPRCGETLDGRAAPEVPTGLAIARAALAPPRLAAKAVMWPVVKTADAMEYYRVWPWMRAVLTTDDGLVGVRPVLHYRSGFAPTAGGRVFYRRLPGVGSEMVGEFQTAGPDIMLGKLLLRAPDRAGLHLGVDWSTRNDRLFAGIGPNSERELAAAGRGLARYASTNLEVGLGWTREVLGPLRLALGTELHRQDYGIEVRQGTESVADLFGLPPDICQANGLGDRCVDEAHLPGFGRGLRLAKVGGGTILDLRPDGRDASGVTFSVDGSYAQGFAGDPSRHGRMGAEMLVAIGGSDRVLLLRGRAAMIERLSDAPIPFAELVTPSGRAGMRGFAEGRFRGESGIVGTAEYRWYLSTYFDATLFVDVGTVAGARFSGIETARWFPSYGLGLRYHDPRPVYWQSPPVTGIQVTYAPDGGFRFLLALAAF